MDTKQEFSLLTNNPAITPAQLFVGPHQETNAATLSMLKQFFCSERGCNRCSTCLHLEHKQHHSVMWLYPEKNYTIDQLDDLFAILSLQLQPDEHFFFVIQKADFLTPACANKLLKPMEEPPAGYHFILTTEHPDQLLITIKSRCIIHTITTRNETESHHPLFEFFTQRTIEPYDFSKMIDSLNLNERESIEILDQIINYWLCAYQKDHNDVITPLINKLNTARLQPPMPGSSTIFWRNLYLQTKQMRLP